MTGCGPLGYIKTVAKDATAAVAQARAAGAEELAPYEYWSAVTYLQESKELMAYSEYERSFDYGIRAQQLAVEATRKAKEREAAELARKGAQPQVAAPRTPSGAPTIDTPSAAEKGAAEAAPTEAKSGEAKSGQATKSGQANGSIAPTEAKSGEKKGSAALAEAKSGEKKGSAASKEAKSGDAKKGAVAPAKAETPVPAEGTGP